MSGSDLRRLVRWGASHDGYCASKGGRFNISPLYCGSTRPQSFALHDNHEPHPKDGHVHSDPWFSTMREAKDAADRKVARENREKIVREAKEIGRRISLEDL